MLDKQKIDEMIQRLIDAVPPGVRNLKQEMEKNFRAILSSAFNKMDLVTREEFDAQVAVLKRTREKLDKLEEKLAHLEKMGKRHTEK